MLGKDARLRNRRRELRQFLNDFCPAPDRPRAKFLRQAVWGLLLSGSLVVARWLRWLGGADRCRKRFWRHKRLLDQLKNPHWDHDALIDRYLRAWARRVAPDTPLILDLTDLAKPRAKKLKYVALVRDGSAPDRGDRPRLVNGYWCFEAYAYWGKGRLTPLLLHPYSIEDPAVKGENAVILDCVDRLMAATAGNGVLVMDAGADRDHLLLPWIERRYPFVVRVKSNRHLLLDDGTRIATDLLADTLLARAARRHPGRGRRVAWCRVFLPERPDRPLYLVVKSRRGQDRPIILLTTLTAENLDTAKAVLAYYRKRWTCEESARFLKSDLGIERFALRTYEAFPRLLFLAVLAMAFLTWLQLHVASLPKWLCARAPGRRQIKFAYYRLLDWFQEQILQAIMRSCPP